MVAAKLAEACARARAAYPGVELDDAVFAARVDELVQADPRLAIDTYAPDLWLATACLRHDRAALEALEARFFPEVIAALRSIDASAAFGDEVMQQLRAKMLVSDKSSDARLAAYSGAGSLAGWLRITALRIGLSLRRKDWREVPVEDAFAAETDPARSPEEQLARRQHAELLARTLREEIAAQPSRTRAILRYYYGDRIGVEELGRIYRVNASTVSRWLAAARETILDGTRKRVAKALGMTAPDADELFGLAHSLEVSLHGLLATVPK